MTTASKKLEFEHFSKFANEWWNDQGKFKILHDIRPIRVRYILDQMMPFKIKDKQILDLGCGGGLLSESLARIGGNVTGVDFIDENIKIAKTHAKENNLNIKYYKQDLQKLKLNTKYDIIILFEIIEHLDNWSNLIKKIKKLLKKNGTIFISTINRNLVSKIFAIYLAENILNWVPKNTHNYNKLIKPSELKNILYNEGFKVKDFSGLFYNPLLNKWQLNKTKTKINYFCTAKFR